MGSQSWLQAAAEQFEKAFDAVLDAMNKDPRQELPGFQMQPLSCLTLCDARSVTGLGS